MLWLWSCSTILSTHRQPLEHWELLLTFTCIAWKCYIFCLMGHIWPWKMIVKYLLSRMELTISRSPNNLKLWLDWLCLCISHDSSKQPIKTNNDDFSKWNIFLLGPQTHEAQKKTRDKNVMFFLQPHTLSGSLSSFNLRQRAEQTLSCFYLMAWSGMGLPKPETSNVRIEKCFDKGLPDFPTQLETYGSIEHKKKSKRVHISIVAWLNGSNKQHD